MLHQLQLDVYALRSELPRTLTTDEARTANSMLDEVVTSAVDRCRQVCLCRAVCSCVISPLSYDNGLLSLAHVQDKPQLMDELSLERYYKTSPHYMALDRKSS